MAKKGHGVYDCPEKSTKKKEDWVTKDWKSKRGQNHNQQEQSTESEQNTANNNDSKPSQQTERKQGWSGLQLSLYSDGKDQEISRMKTQKKNSIISDNGSSLSTFGNPEMVSGIRKSDVTLELATNAGTQESNQVAEVPGYGTVWYDSRAIANIFGLCDLKQKYRVTYDSEHGDILAVHMEDKIIEFKSNSDGLYEYNVSDAYLKEVENKKTETSHVIETVAENKTGFTERQFQRAKAARELYHNVGSPTVDNFKALLKMNVIKNCPVTVADVNAAEKIFGPALSTLKGKPTKQSPKPVIRDKIELPDDIVKLDHNLDLCIDTMFINEIPMLTTIDKTIRFRGLVPLENRTHEEYFKAIDQVLRF